MKKIIKLTLIGVALLTIITYINRTGLLSEVSPESIREFISGFGAYAPLIYIILFAIVPLTFFPDSVLAVSSGLIFGLVKGSLYTMIGAFLGGTLAFFISRTLKKDFIDVLTKGKYDKFHSKIEINGFFTVLILRLIPLFPFDIISYGAGLSKVSYRDFMIGTLIGIIPGVLVFVNIGASSVHMDSSRFYVSISMLIGLFLLSFVLKKKFSGHIMAKQAQDNPQ